MRTYQLQSMAKYWLYAAVIPCIAVLTGIGWIWIASARSTSGQGGAPVWLGVLWLAWVVWGMYRYVTMPHTIELSESGSIRFVGAFRTMAVAPSDVLSVQSFAGQFVYLKYRGGKIMLLSQFTGFNEFLTALKRANSNVAMRGV